jgi:hypothetical protein
MEYKVFISSTFEDLKEYRKAAIEVVNSYECIPLAMEHFMARPGEPVNVCEDEIKQCDIFVGIYAHRYGFIPDGEDKSITQLEYELAKELAKNCLCFIVKDDYSWNPKFFEREKYEKLEAFLNIIKKKRVVSFFESPADFEGKIAASLGKLIASNFKRGAERKKDGVHGDRIHLPPTPFIAHPYPLPEHFTGRDEEMAVLSNWFHNGKEPVLVLEAIGGMGKSAMTWVWMQKEIREKAVEVGGVFWWSFYEAPFERFIQQLACYVMGKRDIQENLLSAELESLQATLHNRRFLLVLDGFERALRGYADMSAMYIQEKGFDGDKTVETEWDKWQREPIHPQAAKFLKHLAASGGKTKTLITTRLAPTNLEDIFGAKHILLKGLSEGDAVRFLRCEGVKGTRAELEHAGNIYDFHPLMLKLLASTIKRSRTNDINEAFHLNLIDRKEPHKILTRSFDLLSEEEKKVASCAAVFCSVFSFEFAVALFPGMEEKQLWQVMQGLRDLGFLFYDEKEKHFDFHPIIRSFLYHRLTNRGEVHNLAVQYFQAVPQKEKIVTLEDLSPVIELYHHLVKAGKFDEAYDLFRDRIHNPAYFQLSAYHLIIELFKELFPGGEDKPPRLKTEVDQAWALSSLANTYSLSGQPAKTVTLSLQSIGITEEIDEKKNLAIDLGNAAKAAQFHIGQFSAAAVHLRKNIAICSEIKDEFWKAAGYRELGRILAFQGRAKAKAAEEYNVLEENNVWAENELARSTAYWEKTGNYQGLSLDYSYRSISALLQARLAEVQESGEKRAASYSREALEQAHKAFASAEKTAETRDPFTRDFIQAYRLLGESLIQCQLFPGTIRIKVFEISFFDDYFQKKMTTIMVESSKKLKAAELCLNEANHRCRKVNLVEFESDILLALARLEWAYWIYFKENDLSKRLISIEKFLKEAYEIAQRAGYRIKLADLHLFCGQVLPKLKKRQKLLGFTAKEHLCKVKEFALDVSQFSDLYRSPKLDFYQGIPEYKVLERGMTEKERIQNGYCIAYKIAEALEQRKAQMQN